MNKIYFIFHGRFPSEKAASLFAAKSCEVFADNNLEVVLLVPRRLNIIKKNYASYYNLNNNFKVVYLPTIDLFFLKFFRDISFYISYLFFSIVTFSYLSVQTRKNDIIYSNEFLPMLFSTLTSSRGYYEVHDFPEKKKFFYKILFKNLKGVIITNKWKLVKIKKIFGLADEKLLYEPNAVDINEVNIDISKEGARERLNLDQKLYYAIYTGHLYSWKGVDTLAKTADLLPDDVRLVFVGGTSDDIKKFKDKYCQNKKIIIVGFVPHDEIPYWQKAADILILPNTAKEDISKYYTSPMKLFEYMASKRPIIASNIPSITEILNKNNAYLFEADNPNDLAEKIKYIINNPDESNKLVSQAWQDVQKYTWSNRIKRILNFIDNG